jgi:hypothetical protein
VSPRLLSSGADVLKDEVPVPPFVCSTATTGARKHCTFEPSENTGGSCSALKSSAEALNNIVWKIHKPVGVTMMLAQARLVMDGIRWCRPGAAAAAEEEARAQFYDPRYGVASLRNQHRFSTRLPSPLSKWGLMAVPKINQ